MHPQRRASAGLVVSKPCIESQVHYGSIVQFTPAPVLGIGPTLVALVAQKCLVRLLYGALPILYKLVRLFALYAWPTAWTPPSIQSALCLVF